MTINTSYLPVAWFDIDITKLTTISSSDTKLVIKVDGHKFVFRGSFTYDFDGNPSGQLDSLNILKNGELLQEYTEIGVDIGDLLVAVETGYFEILKVLFGGNDTFYGSDTFDDMFGFNGADQMYGGGGRDFLGGGNGNDKLYGNKGADFLWGGNGNDKLYGGNGNDILAGSGPKIDFDTGEIISWQSGGGKDVLRGGGGSDIFVFNPSGGAGTTSVVKDFTDGEDLLLFSNFGISTAKEARSFATNVDSDVVFDFGSGNIIIVENVIKSDLRAADFIFEDFIFA